MNAHQFCVPLAVRFDAMRFVWTEWWWFCRMVYSNKFARFSLFAQRIKVMALQKSRADYSCIGELICINGLLLTSRAVFINSCPQWILQQNIPYQIELIISSLINSTNIKQNGNNIVYTWKRHCALHRSLMISVAYRLSSAIILTITSLVSVCYGFSEWFK